jgi:hypothetical protein
METFYLPENLLHLKNSVDKTDDDSELQLYSYKSCDANSPDDLKAYRGLVFENSVLVASSLGYTPEYNEDQIESIPQLDDITISNYNFFKSEEGTLLRVFYHKKWYLSTHRKLDAFKSRWGSNESFGEIFLKCIGMSFEEFTSNLETYHVYLFFIRNTAETRIVSVPPEKYEIYHVGTLLNNEKFDVNHSIGLPKQEQVNFSSLQEIRQYVSNCNPLQSQGVIAFLNDDSGKHFKIINSQYQNYTRIRNNEPDLKFRFLELWRDQTSPLFQTFLYIYPQFLTKASNYTNLSYKIAKGLHNMYYNKFVKKEKIVCHKDEWSILTNVHQWFWEERKTRKVTFDIMYKMLLSDVNLRSFHRMLKNYV